MIVILDTSAAVDMVLNNKKFLNFHKHISNAEWVIAPTLYISEVTNVFWKYYRFGSLSMEECEEAIENAIELPDDFIMEEELYKEAFAMACLTKKSAYDMFFLVLARRNNGLLLTTDNTLKRIAEKHSIRVQ